ncbi:trafficking protein Mon1-domain-containing protein [Rhodocollybia butyracea]|uniref:Vacuolar fusion protein MON1 n=1 Tax=Rhodocollybia butyracea TaxID=206335 RepID=A0A9P5PZ65_9AGAR|nr:trafficking protein Mon1-domain-containing protein [Rhodocollybia butyracea]
MQALISVFIDDGDKLKSINAGRTRITFLQRQPLYYACVSSWGEPESVTRSHLEYLHLQILSVVTSAQLKRIFERRGNFDLRRLLGGADTFLTTMLSRLQLDLAMSMSALRCLRLDSGLRNKAAQALVPSGKVSKDILYIILVARGEIITLIRPKKHSVHPADVHILLTTLASPSLSNSPATAMWVPLCLPKWNDSRMVNAYVVNMPYVDDASLSSNAEIDSLPTPTSLDNPDDDSDSHTSTETRTQRKDNVNHNTITLVCISGGSDFDTVRAWCDDAVEKLSYLPSNSSSSLSSTSSTMTVTPNTAAPPIPRPPASSSTLHYLHTHLLHSSYTVSELGIPGLRHFVYKARGLVQVTFPVWEQGQEKDDSEAEMEEEEGEDDERRRIITMYQMVHDAIHAKGVTGQSKEGLKLQYLRTDKESVLGWITQPFELYLTLSRFYPKAPPLVPLMRWRGG